MSFKERFEHDWPQIKLDKIPPCPFCGKDAVRGESLYREITVPYQDMVNSAKSLMAVGYEYTVTFICNHCETAKAHKVTSKYLSEEAAIFEALDLWLKAGRALEQRPVGMKEI